MQREILALGEAGYREVTLLGQNVDAYGRDLPGAAADGSGDSLVAEWATCYIQCRLIAMILSDITGHMSLLILKLLVCTTLCPSQFPHLF